MQRRGIGAALPGGRFPCRNFASRLVRGRRRVAFEPGGTVLPESVIDYRALLDTTGELEIGAYARRVRRRRAIAGVFGVLLFATACVAYVAMQPRDERTAKRSFTVKVLCTHCGTTTERTTNAREPLPMTCERCNLRTAHVLWTCRVCNAEFVAGSIGRLLECPHCHSAQVGSAAAAAAGG
jgi:DNA-directed RNA polymerase subunit RPC12/RpoP